MGEKKNGQTTCGVFTAIITVLRCHLIKLLLRTLGSRGLVLTRRWLQPMTVRRGSEAARAANR